MGVYFLLWVLMQYYCNYFVTLRFQLWPLGALSVGTCVLWTCPYHCGFCFVLFHFGFECLLPFFAPQDVPHPSYIFPIFIGFSYLKLLLWSTYSKILPFYFWVDFLLLSCKNSLCVMDTSPLVDIYIVRIFSQSAACLFTVLTVSTKEQNILILMKPNVSGWDFQGAKYEMEIRAQEVDEGCF